VSVQTRFYRVENHTVNGLLARQFALTQGGNSSTLQVAITAGASFTVNSTIIRRTSGGVETVIGSNVAPTVAPWGSAATMRSATWAAPAVTLAASDALLVYERGNGASVGIFGTEQLNQPGLLASTWTIFRVTGVFSGGSVGQFFLGAATHNSRVENITFGTAAQVLNVVVSASVRASSGTIRRISLILTTGVRASASAIVERVAQIFSVVVNAGVGASTSVTRQIHLVLTTGVSVATSAIRRVSLILSAGVRTSTSIVRRISLTLNVGVRAASSLLARILGLIRKGPGYTWSERPERYTSTERPDRYDWEDDGR